MGDVDGGDMFADDWDVEDSIRHDSDDDVDEEHPSGSGGREDADVWKYCNMRQKRPMLPCTSEHSAITDLYKRIEKSKPHRLLHFEDAVYVCQKCENNWIFSEVYLQKRRNLVNVYSLAHGTFKAIFYDWVCPLQECREWNPFSGRHDAIFPVRKESAYCTDMMYTLTDYVCRLGMSLRNAYEALIVMRNVTGRSQNVGDSTDWIRSVTSRRRVNEAFRLFLKTISFGGFVTQGQFFTCKTCELPLDSEDKRALGLQNVDVTGLTRLKGIVIDGTASGILDNLPDFSTSSEFLSSPGRMEKASLVTSGLKTSSLRLFYTILRKSLAHFMTPTDEVQVTIPLRAKGVTLKTANIEIIRHYLDPNLCLCPSHSSSESHTAHCISRRKEMSGEAIQICHALSTLFRLQYRAPINSVPIRDDYPESNDDSSSDDTEGHIPGPLHNDTDVPNRNAITGNEHMEWHVSILFPQSRATASFMMATVSLLEFCTLEPVTFPYIVPATSAPVTMRTTIRDQQPDDAPSPLGVAPFEFQNPGKPSSSAALMSAPSFRLHEIMCSDLDVFACCDHDQTEDHNPVCDNCNDRIQATARKFQYVNPLLYMFCLELFHISYLSPKMARAVSAVVAGLLRQHMEHAKKYFLRLDMRMTEGCTRYAEKYGEILIPPMSEVSENDLGELSGTCFPGRERFRPALRFEAAEKHHCSKKYPRSTRFSPGIMTVLCCCSRPKVLGYVVLTRAESTACALSTVLTHFQVPPKTVYYDNGCNMMSSALLRVPWLLHMTRIVIDRFHFKSHTCSAFHDANMYPSMDSDRTTSAESVNARIGRALPYMRYIGGDNFVPFLKVRFALLNLSTEFRNKHNVQDIEDDDLHKFCREMFVCLCCACSSSPKAKVTARNMRLSQDESPDSALPNPEQMIE